MAADTVSRAVTNTLSTTVADTITMTGVEEYIEIINHDATVTLYFTYQWEEVAAAGDVTTAVSGADEAYAVLPASSTVFPARSNHCLLSVVGNGNIYTVQSF